MQKGVRVDEGISIQPFPLKPSQTGTMYVYLLVTLEVLSATMVREEESE